MFTDRSTTSETKCLVNPDDPNENKYVTPNFDVPFTDGAMNEDFGVPSFSDGAPTGPNINIGQFLKSIQLIASVVCFFNLTLNLIIN